MSQLLLPNCFFKGTTISDGAQFSFNLYLDESKTKQNVIHVVFTRSSQMFSSFSFLLKMENGGVVVSAATLHYEHCWFNSGIWQQINGWPFFYFTLIFNN